MRTIRLKISELYQFEGQIPSNPNPHVGELTPLILKQFVFLPQPLIITIEGDEVELQFPEESTGAQIEAARLAQKAAKRAAEGDYPKAIGIFKRVLELQPSLHGARRDLAMAYVEIGDTENALNHLIEVLRLDPQDAWSWVVLANLYIREKSDLETGEKFLRKALEIKLEDAWALNSLGAVCHQQGKDEEAILYFERAIAANPDFVNAYYGEALVLESTGRSELALATLTRLFARARMQDVRSQPVYDNARSLYGEIQMEAAAHCHSDAFKQVLNYKAEMEKVSGFPIRIEETEFADKVGARIQIAWKHDRDYHLLSTRKGYPQELVAHLETHELTHLKLECNARNAGRNLFFTTTAKTRETAIRSVSGDIRKWEKQGFSEDSITQVTLSLTAGLCGFLFNCPLDMLIEHHLYHAFPLLRPAQFLSVGVMAREALHANSDPQIVKMTPKIILKSSLALNGAYSLFLDDLFQAATAYAAPYRKHETFALSQRLYKHWMQRVKPTAVSSLQSPVSSLQSPVSSLQSPVSSLQSKSGRGIRPRRRIRRHARPARLVCMETRLWAPYAHRRTSP